MGRLYFKIIERFDPEWASRLEKQLKSVVIFTKDEGVFYASQYRMEKDEIYFENLNSTTESDLRRELMKSGKITVEDYNRFKVGEKVYSGDRYGVLVYE